MVSSERRSLSERCQCCRRGVAQAERCAQAMVSINNITCTQLARGHTSAVLPICDGCSQAATQARFFECDRCGQAAAQARMSNDGAEVSGIREALLVTEYLFMFPPMAPWSVGGSWCCCCFVTALTTVSWHGFSQFLCHSWLIVSCSRSVA